MKSAAKSLAKTYEINTHKSEDFWLGVSILVFSGQVTVFPLRTESLGFNTL